MYTTWTTITERDLIQKGASYKRIKADLKVEKIVLNLTQPSVESAITLFSKESKSQKTQKNIKLEKGQISTKGKQLISNSTQNDVLNLYVMSLLAIISGQRPILTKARKSIATWKIRKNQLLGCKVTLRGKTALDFLDKTVRFQNINEQDIFTNLDNKEYQQGQKGNKSVSSLKGELTNAYALQSLGNVSIGIKNINLYPELEDLWIAQRLSSKNLGLDLSLNFKKSRTLSQIIHSILRKPGGKHLIENYATKIHTFPVYIKKNKDVLLLNNIIQLRKLYLTSLGLLFV